MPPATPLGAYTVTLSASTGSPAVTRSNTATIQVVDRLAPAIRISIPAEGAKVRLGKRVAADYACTDETNGTGVARCAGPVAPGARISTRSLGRKTFTVSAADKAGNTATAATKYTVLPRLPPAVKVAFNFRRTTRFTEFTSLLIKGVPKRSKVAVTCRPRRRGASCPARSLTKRKASGTVKLKSFVGKRFTPGTVIQIRVTKSGSIGAVKLVEDPRERCSLDRHTLPPPRGEEAAQALLSRDERWGELAHPGLTLPPRADYGRHQGTVRTLEDGRLRTDDDARTEAG